MKIQFDPSQQFQLDAVAAVTDIFDGQPLEKVDYSIIFQTFDTELFSGQARTELGVGNKLTLDDEALRKNIRKIQERNEIEVADTAAKLESWPMLGANQEFLRHCYHFSVEMETGTGKTYVYLRTIFELSQRYGFKKFIIVVPSVAIREGVLKNLEITSEHFRALYNNVEFEYFDYDAKRVNKLRQFAVSNTLQILIINIDAFRKNFADTAEQKKSNVIYKESDKLSGRQPIEFVQATNPIVIIDEPQSVDNTDKAQEAIRALNPLCTLRYSATHKNPYNLVYRLDPVRAFGLRLVKQIVVAGASASGGANDAYVKVERVDFTNGIKAKLRIHVQTSSGPKEKGVTVKDGADLYELSENRACYQDGFVITEINAEPGNEFIRFNNGKVLRQGEEAGGLSDDVWRVQIQNTVKKHLEKELQVKGRGLKVLSLFFIDRVANYRDYDEAGKPSNGKFAVVFEEALTELAKDPKFKELDWLKFPVEKLHNGYFAADKKGILKDTSGTTQADDDAYNLIMKEKERLLSTDEPLRFIFSHSALREGWDNPNVFQICLLREVGSQKERRQTIGRGLRLPVNQDGKRVMDDTINKLLVIGTETYEAFAEGLQKEYESECGVTFGKVPVNAFSKLARWVDGKQTVAGSTASQEIWQTLVTKGFLAADGKIQPTFDPKKKDFALGLPEQHRDLENEVVNVMSSYQLERHIRREKDEGANRLRKEVQLSPEFTELWNRIKPRTTYRVEFNTDDFVARAVQAISHMERIQAARVSYITGNVLVTEAGVTGRGLTAIQEVVEYRGAFPDLLAYLQNETELTRSTLVRILKESKRLAEYFVNPQRFMDSIAAILKHELHRVLINGIKYERIPAGETESEWQMMLFKNEELVNYLSALQVKKSVYEYVVYDSQIERAFAERLDEREDIKLFVKLPGWFEIETPVGKYNPDWAIVKHHDETLYLVRETKSTKDFLKLRTSEADKVRCGQKHFEAIGVPFAVAVTADEV